MKDLLTTILTLFIIPGFVPILNKPPKSVVPQKYANTTINSKWLIPHKIGKNVLEGNLPAWEFINFSNLPPLNSSGNWHSSELDELAQYPLSVEWEKGDSIASILTIGDFRSSFQLQLLSLNSIFIPLSVLPKSVNLAELSFLNSWNLGDLISVIPELKDQKIETITPLLELVKTSKQNVSGKSIGELLEENQGLDSLKLSKLDLSKYTLEAIPQLLSKPLESYKDWQSISISDIPYLTKLPFSFFPNPPQNQGYFGLIKSIELVDSTETMSAISGGINDGFEQKCISSCQIISVGGSEFLSGRSWVESQQKVRGGQGKLAIAAGGLESTGRHPYSRGFKIAVTPVDKTNALIVAYFRRENTEVGKSPYFLGPIVLAETSVGDTLFLGEIQSNFQSVQNSINAPRFDELEELDFLALQKAYEKVLGEFARYSDTSTVIFSGNGDRGKLLGKYRFWSRLPQVRERIAAKKGIGFLQKLESGKDSSMSEFLIMFSPEQQDFLFASRQLELFDLAREQIDPETNNNFTGQRAIERVAQMYLGGIGVVIDSNLVKKEASEIAKNYYQIIQ
ncbi:MAG: hypothetical protein F6K24_02320 [Okeania sp. SIO2D1]|nr:hypothetical protein [Okeania sp. SIO2D1]